LIALRLVAVGVGAVSAAIARKRTRIGRYKMSLPWDNNTWEVAAQIVAERSRRNMAAVLTPTSGLSATAYISPPHLRDVDDLPSPSITDKAQLLVQAVLVPGERTDEGRLIEAVTIPWFDIIAMLE
jgi:hypothetical protein